MPVSLSLWNRCTRTVHAEAVTHYSRLARFYSAKSLELSTSGISDDLGVLSILWLGNAQEALERVTGHASEIEYDTEVQLRVDKARNAVALAEEGITRMGGACEEAR